MKCKYTRYYSANITGIGSARLPFRTFIGCKLKETDRAKQAVIHRTLIEKGYGGSEVDNLCPVAVIESWDDCPFFENVDAG